MRKRVKIALPVLLLAVLGMVVWQIWCLQTRATPDPICKGKRMSEWLKDVDPQTRKLTASAAEALRQMGTNALPRLLMEASAHGFGPTELLIDLLKKQPVLKFHFESNSDHQSKALRGFYALGEAGAVGLAQGLTNSNKWIRHGSIGQWEMEKDYPAILFEPLLNRLKDPDPMVRARAANALGMLGQQPDRVVPVLTGLLHDPDNWVRCMAALGLSLYGDRAKSAVPVLLNCLTNCGSDFRFFGTNALKAINPAAASKAGVK